MPHLTQVTVASDARQSAPAAGRAPVFVRALASADRERLLAHFLSLGDDDRLLRFGQAAPDAVIENYVRTIDFVDDVVFGVFDTHLDLVGVGHLAWLPRTGRDGERAAEFGVSVVERARGHGIGSTLFERAAIRSRNMRVTTLYMQCLSRNAAMMHIARKSGMQIESERGEAGAWLTLPPADPHSVVAEMLHEQAAAFDYALKRQAHHAADLLASLRFQPLAA